MQMNEKIKVLYHFLTIVKFIEMLKWFFKKKKIITKIS